MVLARVFALLVVIVAVSAILAQPQQDKWEGFNWQAACDTIDDLNNEKYVDTALAHLQNLEAEYREHQLPRNHANYAKLLSSISLCKYYKGDYYSAVNYAKQALAINTSRRPGCNLVQAAKDYRRVGYNYRSAGNFPMAILYLDSAITLLQKHFVDCSSQFYNSCIDLCRIHTNQGDYQKALDYAIIGLQQPDTPRYNHLQRIAVLNQWAAHAEMELANKNGAKHSSYQKAKEYLTAAINYYRKNTSAIADNLDDWNACLMDEAIIARYEGHWQQALQVLQAANDTVVKYKNVNTLWWVLNNRVKYYLDDAIADYHTALQLDQEMIALQKQPKFDRDSGEIASFYNDIGYTYSIMHDVKKSLEWVEKSYKLQAGPYAGNSIVHIPTLARLVARPNVQQTFKCLSNKAELMMRLSGSMHDTAYAATAKKLFFLSDSLFTYMRHNQSGVGSKLYWRAKSSGFYEQALEMCSATNDTALAFYYMEKSRAALLNDELSEIKARQFLPVALVQQEDSLKEAVREKTFYISINTFGTPAYRKALLEKDNADQALSSFIAKLETNHPKYYQNKYADRVLDTAQLQQYLRQNQQQWLQYFLSDTLLFVLHADGHQLRLYRQKVHNFKHTLRWFLNKCADENFQKNVDNYAAYLCTGAHIYDTLLRPIATLKKGRLIVSPDDIVIPFDALSTDSTKGKWIMQDYAISYAYSARSLLHTSGQQTGSARGNFLGWAPVQFRDSNLQSLYESEATIQSSKQYYTGTKVLTGRAATSHALLSKMGKYTVVNLLTHASGNDTLEPQIYTADTPVLLSQIQVIHDPSTQVVILSACETNSGKQANGEGVLSLARGFVIAGVPAAVATLWNANEQSTYFINDSLNKYISQGMPLDSALQKAKLAWLQQNPESAPYYWANLTLMGSAQSVHLKKDNSATIICWVAAGLLLIGAGAYWVRKKITPTLSGNKIVSLY